MRPQFAQGKLGRRRMRTQPHPAGFQIDLCIVDACFAQHRVQFQRVQQHLHAMRQFQRLAAFQIRQPQVPPPVLARQHGNQIRMVIADGDQLRIDPIPIVEFRRQVQRRLVDHGSRPRRAEQLDRLLPIKPPRMTRPIARRDVDVRSRVPLQHRLFPGVATFQQRLEDRTVIELEFGQSLLAAQFRTGGQKAKEPFAVVKEVPSDGRRAGAKRRVGHERSGCPYQVGENRSPAGKP